MLAASKITIEVISPSIGKSGILEVLLSVCLLYFQCFLCSDFWLFICFRECLRHALLDFCDVAQQVLLLLTAAEVQHLSALLVWVKTMR